MNDQIALREKRRQELGETSFATGTQGGALMQPRNGRELMDMANLMSGSGQMVRDFYRGNPGDCAALIMICQPYGFNPFMVSWKTYKASKNADAPISFEGQLVSAMVNQSAPVRGRLRYAYDGDGDAMTCTVTGIDRETGDAITYTSPPIGKIPTKNSPLWKADPQQQLGYFSARAWARRHFPELLLGVYTREEIEEAPMRDVTPKAGGFAQMVQAAREEPKPVEDAEILPDDYIPEFDGEPAEQQSGEDEPDTRAFEFDEGIFAAKEGKPVSACPYHNDPVKMRDWIGGWKHQEAKA